MCHRSLVFMLGWLFLQGPFASLSTASDLAPGLRYIDEFTIDGPRNFLTAIPAMNIDGTVNAVVEIPTGTTAKWEVSKPDGRLKWEFKDGRPRVVRYLGYPGNYGMIPRTHLALAQGGDGDPLDVIVLGDALPRGAVVPVRVLGVLKLLDGGEVDDKIVAVPASSPLAKAGNPAEMQAQFPGALSIIETWFENYKGPGKIKSGGFDGPEAALQIITAASSAFDK